MLPGMPRICPHLDCRHDAVQSITSCTYSSGQWSGSGFGKRARASESMQASLWRMTSAGEALGPYGFAPQYM
jgi:hypothetical protein